MKSAGHTLAVASYSRAKLSSRPNRAANTSTWHHKGNRFPVSRFVYSRFPQSEKLSLSLCLCQMSRQGGTTRKWRTVKEKAEKSLMSAAQATGYLNYRPLTGKSRRPETFCWQVLPPGATAFNILSRKIMGHLHAVNWKCQQSDIAGAFLSSER